MVGNKVGRSSILNRLQKLEALQAARDQVPVLMIGVEDSGLICVGEPGSGQQFETMFEAELYISGIRGITDQTIFMINDMPVSVYDIYLPTDVILYGCRAAERRESFMAAGSPAAWVEHYADLVDRLQARIIENPGTEIPGLDDPAVKELIRIRNSCSLEQLVQEFRDVKWFRRAAL